MVRLLGSLFPTLRSALRTSTALALENLVRPEPLYDLDTEHAWLVLDFDPGQPLEAY